MEDGAKRVKEPEAVNDLQANCFPDMTGQCTYELIAIVTACTRSVKGQARPHTNIDKGARHKVPSLIKQLLGISKC